MRPMKLRSRQRGFLFLIFVVTVAVAGTVGTLTVKAIQTQQAPVDSVINKIVTGAPIGDQEMTVALNARAQQFRIAGAGANMLNAIDVAPDSKSVVSGFAGGVIDKVVDAASKAAPVAGNPLPPDVGGTSPFQGRFNGSWSGTCGVLIGAVSGGLSMNIDAGGAVSGTFSGDESGTISGSVSQSGSLKTVSGSGSGGVSWSGNFVVGAGGVFGNGSWNDSGGCSGGWSAN